MRRGEKKSQIRSQFRLIGLFCAVVIIGLSFNPLKAEEFSKSYTDRASVESLGIIKSKFEHCTKVNIEEAPGSDVTLSVRYVIDVDDSDDKETAKDMLNSMDFTIERWNLIEVRPFKERSQSIGFFWGNGDTEVVTVEGRSYTFTGKCSIEIYVDITVPKRSDLKLESRHSNINMGSIDAKLLLDLQHSTFSGEDIGFLDMSARFGDVNMGRVVDEANISMSHSQLNCLGVGDLEITMEHSTVVINRTANLNIGSIAHSEFTSDGAASCSVGSSAHSTINIDDADIVTIGSFQHGNLDLDDIYSINLRSAAHSNIDIESVIKNIEINAAHSNIKIESVGSDIDQIDIEDSHGAITLGLDNLSSVDVLLESADFTSVNRGDFTKKSDGFYQKREGGGVVKEVNIRASHGTLNLR